ncbi:MAG: choice-of-anchor J domain-containing protein [Dehalococcoidia bacterium]|nr:choice-of-anchor J domain-containing protein [Dehalococcoidia bacterium]
MKGEIVIMRKTLMIVSALVMVSAMIIGSASTVSAGKPQPYLSGSAEMLIYDDAGIYDTPGLVYVDYSLQWENIGAWGYKVEWGPTYTNPTAYNLTAGGKKFRNLQTTLKLVIPEETIEEQYTINAILLDRKGNPIGWWDADTFYPNNLMKATTAMYAEHFDGVATGNLPSGWSTNKTDLCYVVYSEDAGGVAPELLISWDNYAWYDIYSDYWVATPEIETTAATSNLTLSFDHMFDLYEEAVPGYPYTMAVEVSANNGTTWTATSFIDSPDLTKYPSGYIGPEKVNIDLSTYGGQTIMIRWRLYGYTYNMDYWNIDNVVLTGY